MLWHDREEPDPAGENNDWWLRQTQDLVFDQSARNFVPLYQSGIDYTILTFLDEDAVDAPKIALTYLEYF